MKIILILLLAYFVYTYRTSIAKIIVAIITSIVLVGIVLKLWGDTLLAIVLTLGGWALIFGFFHLVTSEPSTKGMYDDMFEEWDKWNRRHHR